MSVSHGLLALTLVVAASGCAQTSQPKSCANVGGIPMLEYQLFFGRDIPGRAALTEQEWTEFTEQVIAPHLPDGFTAFDAYGQWLNPTANRISKEHTKVVIVAVPETEASAAAIAAIKDAYRTRFHQQVVGMTVFPTCASF